LAYSWHIRAWEVLWGRGNLMNGSPLKTEKEKFPSDLSAKKGFAVFEE
jgi:hypothetical protein